MNDNLSNEQKHILFDKGTELPFSGTLLQEKRKGDFVCANCGAVLFSSDTKFESGSGWPSFTEPKNRGNVALTDDKSLGMVRTEVSCANCGGHLGHVFNDGPVKHGGQRYCINSLSLSFTPDETTNVKN